MSMGSDVWGRSVKHLAKAERGLVVSVTARSASGKKKPSGKYCEHDFKYLVAISYASEIRKTVARLDRGLVELLGGDADRVFFDQRSLPSRLAPSDVDDVLVREFAETLLYVRLWSPAYNDSKYTEIEKLTVGDLLLKKKDRTYTIQAAEGSIPLSMVIDAQLVGDGRQPLWKVAAEIVARLDQLLGSDFEETRRRNRAFVKWDPPAYYAMFAVKNKADCAFDCHQALAACCEVGELHCIASQLVAQLTSLGSMAQNAASANETKKSSEPIAREHANANLTTACAELLKVFAARCEHLDDMTRVRGGKTGAKKMGVTFASRPDDSRAHQAERLRDFIHRYIPDLADSEMPDNLASSVLTIAESNQLNKGLPGELHSVANQLVFWSQQIANMIVRISSVRNYLPRMNRLGSCPKSAAATYATQTTDELIPLV